MYSCSSVRRTTSRSPSAISDRSSDRISSGEVMVAARSSTPFAPGARRAPPDHSSNASIDSMRRRCASGRRGASSALSRIRSGSASGAREMDLGPRGWRARHRETPPRGRRSGRGPSRASPAARAAFRTRECRLSAACSNGGRSRDDRPPTIDPGRLARWGPTSPRSRGKPRSGCAMTRSASPSRSYRMVADHPGDVREQRVLGGERLAQPVVDLLLRAMAEILDGRRTSRTIIGPDPGAASTRTAGRGGPARPPPSPVPSDHVRWCRCTALVR